MKMDLVPEAISYKSHVRLLNPDQKENLRDQIDKWLEQGVIEHSVALGSPLVPVKKKDGQTRWVTDLRELNNQMVKDMLPFNQYSRNTSQSARSYCFLISGCLRSISCSKN